MAESHPRHRTIANLRASIADAEALVERYREMARQASAKPRVLQALLQAGEARLEIMRRNLNVVLADTAEASPPQQRKPRRRGSYRDTADRREPA